MSPQLQDEAKFPQVEPGDGHYESFFVKAARPGGGEAVWLRHTVHKRPGHPPTASLWLTLFDVITGPAATKLTVSAGQLSAPLGGYIEIAGARLDGTGARGEIDGSADWDLRFAGEDRPFEHLPLARMYSAPLPRTKLRSPHPDLVVSGRVRLGDRTLNLDRWPGTMGHNWGASHADQWIWIHGSGFADRPGGVWLDLALGRVRLGPLTTPWIANGALRVGGHRHRLGGLGALRGLQLTETPTGCDFSLPGEGLQLAGRVTAPANRFVGWRYADPAGDQRHVTNCSVADMQLTVTPDDRAAETLAVRGAAAYERGSRDAQHAVELQPFADGLGG